MAVTGQVPETNAGRLGCGSQVIGPLILRRQRSRADILAGFSGVVARRGREWPGAACPCMFLGSLLMAGHVHALGPALFQEGVGTAWRTATERFRFAVLSDSGRATCRFQALILDDIAALQYLRGCDRLIEVAR